MTFPGFIKEEDQLQDGKKIQRMFSHSYELPPLVEPESPPSHRSGPDSGRGPVRQRRSWAARKLTKKVHIPTA